MNIQTVTKNKVISKTLFSRTDKEVKRVIVAVMSDSYGETMDDTLFKLKIYLTDIFNSFIKEDLIERYVVKPSFKDIATIGIDIKYRQRNCMADTQISYNVIYWD